MNFSALLTIPILIRIIREYRTTEFHSMRKRRSDITHSFVREFAWVYILSIQLLEK